MIGSIVFFSSRGIYWFGLHFLFWCPGIQNKREWFFGVDLDISSIWGPVSLHSKVTWRPGIICIDCSGGISATCPLANIFKQLPFVIRTFGLWTPCSNRAPLSHVGVIIGHLFRGINSLWVTRYITYFVDPCKPPILKKSDESSFCCLPAPSQVLRQMLGDARVKTTSCHGL